MEILRFKHKVWIHSQYHVVYLGSSLNNQLESVLLVASLKSKIEAALKYIKKEIYRRILQEVAIEVKRFLIIV